ncbi:hypothetical protein POM88_044970 [Heracleum sosnowskyi]|uniref:Uncharacterized protein n=1 Tax=Heracleum sosnowskyi TaxID=360622 RepID=A0AAD8M4F8_9APIA|nr:hypothetical protein POM88_044970 [Heracleum sosnowskyi]
MVFLVHKLAFHHHSPHPSEAFLVSLQAFRSNVSNSLAKLMLNSSDPGSELLSIKWLHECFEVLSIVNKAFAKLVVEIDYPMTKWEVSCMEEYLSYSLSLLDSLNSISYALSQLRQARVLLSHALSVNKSFSDKFMALNKIMYKNFSNDLKVIKGIGESKRKSVGGKELVLHEALLVLKSIGSWMVENKEVLKEIKGVNDAVECHVSATANGKSADHYAQQLQGRFEVIEKAQTGIEGAVDLMFSYSLTVGNELIHTLRQPKQ